MELAFKPIYVGDQIIGFEHMSPDIHFFFGTRHLDKAALVARYPHYRFAFLKQVHGPDLIRAEPGQLPVADGHWTDRPGEALVIQTADCIPLLIGHKGMVVALHAGWRGVAQNLPQTAAQHWKAKASSAPKVAIGPHILGEDFEVGIDVAEQLARAHGIQAVEAIQAKAHPDPQKRFVDLQGIVRHQIRRALGGDSPTYLSPFSTLSSELFHSYRRGKQTHERQYSFAVLLK